MIVFSLSKRSAQEIKTANRTRSLTVSPTVLPGSAEYTTLAAPRTRNNVSIMVRGSRKTALSLRRISSRKSTREKAARIKAKLVSFARDTIPSISPILPKSGYQVMEISRATATRASIPLIITELLLLNQR